MYTLPKTLSGFVWHFLKKHWKWLVAIQIFALGWTLDHTLWPYVIMVLVDDITNFTGDRSQMWSYLAAPIIMGLTLWIVVELFFRFCGFLLSRVIPKLEAEIRTSMFNYVQHHSYQYFSNQMAGAIANKISDMPQSLTRALQQVILLFIPVLMALIVSTIFFFRISPLFAILLCVWAAVQLIICLYYAKKCDRASNLHAEKRSELAGKIVDSLTNNTNVRLFARHRYEYQYLNKYQKEEQHLHWKTLWELEKMKMALGLTAFLGIGLALNWYMLYSWQQEWITTGEVVFIFNTTWNITMMVFIAGLELPQLFKEIGICRQAISIIQAPHDIVNAKDAKPLKVNKGEIVFDNVTFRYGTGAKLFQNKNITIPAGQKVGLVGFSGSGKTTFVNLILRYYDIEQGAILIDGQNIAKVTQDSLHDQIAVIPQDPSLFHRSLMENIRYGSLNATDEEVIEASIKAHCHDFVMKMPEKYTALVGERGIKLSGGQRQRIAIARAILKNAPILILDEATSALDSVTEKEIQDGLDLLMQGHTTIVVAHRLSTLSGMDRILVFKEGKIIEDGNHDELMAAQGHYAKMWDMQAGGFLPEEE